MFVPGVNGSIISNAPSGSRLKSAYKNSKKRKMPNGGTLPPRYTSNPRDPRLLKFNDSMSAYNYGEGQYRSIQKIMDSARSPKNADFRENYTIRPLSYAEGPPLKLDAYRGPNGYLMNPYKNYYEDYRQKPLTLTEKIFGNDKKAYSINSKTNEIVSGKSRNNDTGDDMFVGYSRFKKPVAPIYYGENKKPTASTRSILTKVSKPYVYKKPEVVPEVVETPVVEPPKPSLFVSNIDRDMYTPGGGMAREYNIGVTLQDGSKKAFRTEKEYQDWKTANNLDITNAKVSEGRGYSYNYPENKKYGGRIMPNGGETDPVMEGERMQELPIHKKLSWSEKLRRNINRFEKKIGLGSAKKVNDVTEGSTSWTPTVPKPYMRTMQEPPGGYRDNMKVVTPDSFIDSATRARIDAQQEEEARRKRSGVISQGTPKSAYEKAREASSFVSQAKRRKGSADPLDYVLDMVNPAAIGFAGIDLVDNTGSAVSNVAQGNFKEAGSDLLNAGINALDVVPLTRGLGLGKIAKPAIKKVAQPFLKYADDVVQTSKIAGKPALPTYKNVYRAEHANFNTMAKPDDLTGRWALDNPKDAEFYVRNLKTPRGDSYTTSNYFKGEVEPVRIMRDRLPEYKMKQQFAEGMPEQARIMSMGKGKLTDKELASVLGDDAADRMRKGILTEMDYNTMSTAPFMYNTTEGILDANRMNQLRKGENTFLGRGKTSLFPDQKKAVDYLDAQNNSRYSASPFTKYLPFSTYKNGGKIEDDKDMVNGVASILRRVESKPNRLKLANQLSKQFNREKVKYDLPSFLNKSKVKK